MKGRDEKEGRRDKGNEKRPKGKEGGWERRKKYTHNSRKGNKV